MSVAIKTNPVLWKSVVQSVKKSNKGGKPGQWSARKAQLAVKIYKSRGGRYSSKKSKSNSLHKWTKEKWRTKSGKSSIMGPNPTGERYLPSKVIKQISSKEYNYSTKLKRLAIRKGKQYSSQPKSVKRKLSKYLKK